MFVTARKMKYNLQDDVYHSIPSGLNMLSSIQIPNCWTNLDVGGAEASRSNSPALYSWPCNPLAPDETKKHILSRERTPEGYRRIKGTHRGNVYILKHE